METLEVRQMRYLENHKVHEMFTVRIRRWRQKQTPDQLVPHTFVGRRKRFSRCGSLNFSPWPYHVCATKGYTATGGWIAVQTMYYTNRPRFKSRRLRKNF